MRHYEYLRQACNKKFSLVLTVAEHDKGNIKCPKCGSSNVEQQWSAFFCHDFEKELIRILHEAIRPTLDSRLQKLSFT